MPSLPAPPQLTDTPVHHQHSCLALSTRLISHLHRYIARDHELRREHEPNSVVRTIILSVGSGIGVLERLLQDSFANVAWDDVADEIWVFGVEVIDPSVTESRTSHGVSGTLNAYLRRELRLTVRGTWDVLGRADLLGKLDDDDSAVDDIEDVPSDNGSGTGIVGEHVNVVMLFIYPRQPMLLRRYLESWQPRTAVGEFKRGTLVTLRGLVWAGPRADWADDYEAIFGGLDQQSDDKDRDWDVNVSWGAAIGVAEGEGVAIAMRDPLPGEYRLRPQVTSTSPVETYAPATIELGEPAQH
jgi:hypothetical protein